MGGGCCFLLLLFTFIPFLMAVLAYLELCVCVCVLCVHCSGVEEVGRRRREGLVMMMKGRVVLTALSTKKYQF